MEAQKKRELDRIRAFYDSVYYRDVSRPVSVPFHFRRLARRMSVRPGMHVLDVACGTGSWLRTVLQAGGVPHGVDLSARAIAACQADMPHGEFHACAAEALPFADKQFDVVSCLGSIEHFVDPAMALREMVRVAKDQAEFLLLVPNANFLTRRLGLYGGTEQAAVKEVVRTPAEWLDLFARCEIEVGERWADLHVLTPGWIFAKGGARAPLRALQALALTVWPLDWQYQIYHRGRKRARRGG
jgi:ubiquinone/menaquinone biosynthesis C-methylase UbiE